MIYRLEIAAALLEALSDDPKTLILGAGVTDPKGIFGTTLEPAQTFPERVLETPLSENMLTGACLGLALEGWKPIFVHARCDFLLLTMEHLLNTSAKWREVHNDRKFTMVVRCLVGRGWGQGPNHSQAFHAMLAHVPGMRVLYPVDPGNIRHWVNEALSCGSPTVIMEPRRMYEVEKLEFPMWDNPDAYLVTFGDVVLDAATAAVEFGKIGVKIQVHPMEDVSAMDLPQTLAPVVVVDTGHLFCGATAEVAAQLAAAGNPKVKRVGPPFTPLPTSYALEQEWYPSVNDIINAVSDLLEIQNPNLEVAHKNENDQAFRGPF